VNQISWFHLIKRHGREDQIMTKAAKKVDAKAEANATGVSKTVQNHMDKLTTKSAKIRLLDQEGFTRSEIAKIMGVRYQHVRNVLITPLTGKAVAK
jgi:DNA-directed RNA polymerase specialized sigma24 family protein